MLSVLDDVLARLREELDLDEPRAKALIDAACAQIGVDARDRDHARRFLADLASGIYDLKYYYFDVHAADWLFLGGAVSRVREIGCLIFHVRHSSTDFIDQFAPPVEQNAPEMLDLLIVHVAFAAPGFVGLEVIKLL